MKSIYLVANWKMNLSPVESLALSKKIKAGVRFRSSQIPNIVVCPSFESIAEVGQIIGNSKLALGAQDVFWQERGSFTGEVSAASLVDLGCRYVIVGHSERRKYLAETNDMINRKIIMALNAGLIPIVCVGETIEQRREHTQDLTVMTQVQEALAGIALDQEKKVLIAYEPVWVIGSGQAIDATEADRMSRVIRQALIDLFPLDTVNNQCHILYGGSVDSENIAEFMASQFLQGSLVGGASLTAENFLSLIKAIV